MMEAAQVEPWSDLPPELLSLVLKRLPSLADRVRLRAVCHPWRSNSKLQTLPPPFPWLTLPNGTFLSIPGGEVHRLPVPDCASCYGSIDNWLFIKSSDDACALMNPFSKTTLDLPNLVTVWQRTVRYESDPKQLMYKLVAPSPLDLSLDSIVAALIMDDGNIGTLCISQPPIATYSLRDNRQPLQHLWDIAFFDGKLYVVSVFGKLLSLELSKSLGSNPNIKTVIDSYRSERPECIPRDAACTYRLYLVECGGRLLMTCALTLANGEGSVIWVAMLCSLDSMAPSLCLLQNAVDPKKTASTSCATIPHQSILKILSEMLVCTT
uniref:Uncharacterized protein n=1 Tax=Avena sativa TaxID=4498 RepID=A0ACD6A536_AVESA